MTGPMIRTMTLQELTAVNFQKAGIALLRGLSKNFIHTPRNLPHDDAKGGTA